MQEYILEELKSIQSSIRRQERHQTSPVTARGVYALETIEVLLPNYPEKKINFITGKIFSLPGIASIEHRYSDSGALSLRMTVSDKEALTAIEEFIAKEIPYAKIMR